MKKIRLYRLLPVLALLLLFACKDQDQVDKDGTNGGDNQAFTQHTVYGMYGVQDTLLYYKQYEDEWSTLSHEDYYHFRIQNYKEQTVVTFSYIPKTVAVGDAFSVVISTIGVSGIAEGMKEVVVVFKDNHRLQLYCAADKTHYVVYY